MSTLKDQALIIRGADWSESSRIITCWTRDHGKIRLLAKGGRRLRSNFEISLDLLNLCHIVFIPKQSGLGILTEARFARRFSGIHTNLNHYYSSCYIAELLDAGLLEADPHPGLFDQTISTLETLAEDRELITATLGRFELAWLRETGYSPRIETCVGCEAKVEIHLEARNWFSSNLGGILCANCASLNREKTSVPSRVLSRLAKDDWSRQPGEENAEDDFGTMRLLLGQAIRMILGRELRMAKYSTGSNSVSDS
jgi:DNA repair protein RecO (recombination protein O)